MSTPNYGDTPPQQRRQIQSANMNNTNLVDYMQQMIDMQYEVQRFDFRDAEVEAQRPRSSSNDVDVDNMEEETTVAQVSLFTNTNAGNANEASGDSSAPPSSLPESLRDQMPSSTAGHGAVQPGTHIADVATQNAVEIDPTDPPRVYPFPSNGGLANQQSAAVEDDDDDSLPVGQGTIIFTGSRFAMRCDSAQSDNTPPPSRMMAPPPSLMPAAPNNTINRNRGINYNNSASGLSLQNAIISYGALNDNSDENHADQLTNGAYNATEPDDNTEAISLLPYMNVNRTQQKNRYNDYMQDYVDDEDKKSIWSKFCCCLQQQSQIRTPFICRCFLSLFDATSQRSFCYGAIDGMLTGSGIVFSLAGLGWLSFSYNAADGGNCASSTTSVALRLWVVIFAGTACLADSICMALGHVWSTHIMATSQGREIKEMQQFVNSEKSKAKGQVVDLLLSKGVLKIDAMCLVDTLAGYPDIMTSLLTSESLGSPPVPSPPEEIIPRYDDIQDDYVSHDDLPSSMSQSRIPSASSIARQYSYGGLANQLDYYHNDPEVMAVSIANSEARRESLCMLIGFSMFALIPSLIFWYLPAENICNFDNRLGDNAYHTQFVYNNNNEYPVDDPQIGYESYDGNSYSSSLATTPVTATETVASPQTWVILITSIIMAILGAWKSRFVDGNWLVFASESVAVLLVCMGVTYGLGYFLSRWLLPDFEITVIVR